ncbi:MAG TPA: LptF/LptG family permease [Oceanipulchritudo sp.]|nr:LptF/LptG family permease [Oceanipulchritudo sp.]
MRIDRYILSEWLKVFLLTVLVIFGVLLLGDVQDNLEDLLGFGASPGQIAAYYLILLPALMPVALPISFMVSLLFGLGQLHRNQEITAFRAAGLSLFRITRSLWVVGVILVVVLFQLNARLVPWSVETSRELWNDLAFSKALEEETPVESVGLLYNLTFYNRKDGRLWFLNRFNEYNYRAYGVTVSELGTVDGLELRRLVANEAWYDDLSESWTFRWGREILFDETDGQPVRSLPFDRKVLAGFTEDPELMKYLEKRPKDLSLRELEMVLDYLRPAEDPRLARYAVTFYDRMLNPFSFLIILGLAIPFSVTGVRTNPFVGVSKAMGWFLLYFLLVNVGQLAGASGFPPLWAASIPNLFGFLLVGYYYTRLQHP